MTVNVQRALAANGRVGDWLLGALSHGETNGELPDLTGVPFAPEWRWLLLALFYCPTLGLPDSPVLETSKGHRWDWLGWCAAQGVGVEAPESCSALDLLLLWLTAKGVPMADGQDMVERAVRNAKAAREASA